MTGQANDTSADVAQVAGPDQASPQAPHRHIFDPRHRWLDWQQKLLAWWHLTGPIVRAAERSSRAIRILNRTVSDALVAGLLNADEVLKPAGTGGESTRDLRRVRQSVLRLCDVDFAWVRRATLAYLKEKVEGAEQQFREPPARCISIDNGRQ